MSCADGFKFLLTNVAEPFHSDMVRDSSFTAVSFLTIVKGRFGETLIPMLIMVALEGVWCKHMVSQIPCHTLSPHCI
jgi:hypothetical protein